MFLASAIVSGITKRYISSLSFADFSRIYCTSVRGLNNVSTEVKTSIESYQHIVFYSRVSKYICIGGNVINFGKIVLKIVKMSKIFTMLLQYSRCLIRKNASDQSSSYHTIRWAANVLQQLCLVLSREARIQQNIVDIPSPLDTFSTISCDNAHCRDRIIHSSLIHTATAIEVQYSITSMRKSVEAYTYF